MKHASTRMIFSYWDALRGERSAPERGEIEPGEIRHFLADTFVLELSPDCAAEVRLAGARICAFFGRELKGERFERLWNDSSREEVRRCLRIVVEESAGVIAGVSGTTDDGASVHFEMVLLPLRHRGKPHARMLGALSPAIMPAWIGTYPIRSLSTSSLRVLWPSGRPGEREFSHVNASPAEKRRSFVVHSGGRICP